MDKLVNKPPLIDPITKQNLEHYKTLYQHSINNPEVYWEGIAKSITWNRPWKAVNTSDFFTGKIKWFEEAKLNACYNCLDRHVESGHGDKPAIIWEGNDQSNNLTLTYEEILEKVEKFSNVLKNLGVRKGYRI